MNLAKIFDTHFPTYKKVASSQAGIALLVAMFSVILITFLATEISYEARLDYEFSASRYHEVKAYYAAKSGVEISKFRIHLYNNAKQQFGDKIPDPSMLNMLWSFPFIWPPILPETASLIAQNDVKDLRENTLQDSEYATTITSMGKKIEINNLISQSESLAKSTKEQIMQSIRNRLEKEDEWADENSNLDPEELVNHMIDYIDRDTDS
ncbi:MAG: hypothetical protein AB8E15_03210, partial [Bdellovibrionales bacterium]